MKNRISVEDAVQRIADGLMVIVTDHEDRENEGDLVGAARFATPEMINFMAANARGLICCAVDDSVAEKAGLSLMSDESGPGAIHGTRFCMPIDLIENCTTGISAFDRSRTLQRLTESGCRPEDFARPGHMFPILEAGGGLARRQGHTEASVFLARAAGLEGAAVICEMMDTDGTMVRGERIEVLAEEWELGVLSVSDIKEYHDRKHRHIRLPTEYGQFRMEFLDPDEKADEHFALYPEQSWSDHHDGPLVRIHSECLTGDLLGSHRCDCGAQLREALRRIEGEGGYLLYLRQEGRGIGLRAKTRAYALQDEGMDTVDANLHLGYPADDRDYRLAADFLLARGISRIRMMTNNRDKIRQLEESGMKVTRTPLIVGERDENRRYIETKQVRMGHLSA